MQNETTASKTRLAMIFGAALASALCGVWLASKWSLSLQAPRASLALSASTLIEPAKPLPAFSLIDHNGSVFDNARLANRWSFLFFGFTHCPGPCPTTLFMLNGVSRALESLPERQRPQILFISVDAKRDTPEVMKSYVLGFNPTFVGVAGKQASLDALTAALGVPSEILPAQSGDNYMVDHSLAILLTDPHGRLRATFTPPHDAAAIAKDYQAVIAHEGR